MGNLPFNINLPYLLVLVGISVGAILLVYFAQKAALKKLSHTLYQNEDIAGYNRLLGSLPYRLVLRRATIGLLRLEGAIYTKEEAAVWQAAARLEQLKRLKPGERLNAYQKTLSFAVTAGNAPRAHTALQKLEALLANEKDDRLQAVLADARLLVGVYINKDVGLLSDLRALEEKQTGQRKGLTQYRLAKLYHFAGKPQTAQKCLEGAVENLAGNPWQAVAQAALEDDAVLEAQ